MKTDRELFALAAKAAGYEFAESTLRPGIFQVRIRPRQTHLVDWTDWNPRDDDGDALRLAVKLELLYPDDAGSPVWLVEFDAADPDIYAATRRAIVRAAAALGEQT